MKPVQKSEPVPFAVMHQSWCSLTFLHWRYPAEVIARHLPRSLEVDSFGGSAWVGVTPFVVSRLRPPLLPPLPWLSQFPETNCRTYVRGPNGTPGIWFFSLDAARAAAVIGARLGYGLPYAWSRMRVDIEQTRVAYRSTRRWLGPPAVTDIAIDRLMPIQAGELETFLTARFRLFSFIAGVLTHTDVEHAPWPLEQARVIRAEQTLITAAGLPAPETPPLVHFSPGVRVRVGAPRRVRSA